MEYRTNITRQMKGQAALEYLLLLVVVTFLIKNIVSSERFTKFLGSDGPLLQEVARRMETNYRHAFSLPESGPFDPTSDYGNYTGKHDSYANRVSNSSRFTLSQDKYP